MIAIINGVTVMGNPEEIKHYKELTANTKTTSSITTTFTQPTINVSATTDINKVADELNKQLKAKAWGMV